jgi:PHD/YefM family antitoxin component YafN of YafNO toxin-antitoxin module
LATSEVEIVRNAKGEETAVIVPIALWREIKAERETAYLMSSPANRQRLTGR